MRIPAIFLGLAIKGLGPSSIQELVLVLQIYVMLDKLSQELTTFKESKYFIAAASFQKVIVPLLVNISYLNLAEVLVAGLGLENGFGQPVKY